LRKIRIIFGPHLPESEFPVRKKEMNAHTRNILGKHMKKGLIVLPILILSMLFMGCEAEKTPVMPGASELELEGLSKGKAAAATVSAEAMGEFAGYNETNDPDYGIYSYTLWAGKHNDAGTVTVTNDDANIFVTINTNGSADLGEVHVYVWSSLDDFDATGKRPAPGQAPYKASGLNSDSYTLSIPADISCGGTFYFSAHAALVENNTSDDEAGDGSNAGETAYAGDFNSPNMYDSQKGAWWSYSPYTVACFYDLSGTVYEDFDNSGDMEDETVFEGLTVTLTVGDEVFTTVTDADGNYLFEHVEGGSSGTVTVEAPAGDYAANENAGGYSFNDLSSDAADVDFGFVPLWDLSVNVTVEADCEYTLTVTFDGQALSGDNGFYFVENQFPGTNYELLVTASNSEGTVTESWTGSLTADLTLEYTLSLDCPATDEFCGLIANGSFENGLSSWSGSAYTTPGNPQPLDWGTYSAYDGAYTIDLVGTGAGAGYIEQSISTVSGSYYKITFYTRPNTSPNSGNEYIDLTVDGQTERFTAEANSGWTEKTYVFQANGSQTTVRFAGVYGGDDSGAFLDAICIDETDAPNNGGGGTGNPVLGGSETAYAYGSFDFLNDGFSRWGWRNDFDINTPRNSMTQPIYAGAGQSDISKGTLVGYVKYEVVSSFVNLLTVEVSMLDGYEFTEFQLYVGTDAYPLKNGVPTVAPGQYTVVKAFPDGMSYAFANNGGNIFGKDGFILLPGFGSAMGDESVILHLTVRDAQ